MGRVLERFGDVVWFVLGMCLERFGTFLVSFCDVLLVCVWQVFETLVLFFVPPLEVLNKSYNLLVNIFVSLEGGTWKSWGCG